MTFYMRRDDAEYTSAIEFFCMCPTRGLADQKKVGVSKDRISDLLEIFFISTI